jgi:quercetin dioxygenase-like cupin family protein
MTLGIKGEKQEVFEIAAGESLFIPKGMAHSAVLHTPEIQILFITPKDGNVSWNLDGTRPIRHN